MLRHDIQEPRRNFMPKGRRYQYLDAQDFQIKRCKFYADLLEGTGNSSPLIPQLWSPSARYLVV